MCVVLPKNCLVVLGLVEALSVLVETEIENRRNTKVLQYFVIYQKLCSPWVNMSVLGSSINLQQNPPNPSISSDLISQQGVLDTCNTCCGGTNIFKIRYIQHPSSSYPDFSFLSMMEEPELIPYFILIYMSF